MNVLQLLGGLRWCNYLNTNVSGYFASALNQYSTQMKKLILTVIFFTTGFLIFGQEQNVTDPQRLSILETQIQNLQKQLQENSTKDLIAQLDDLKKIEITNWAK